MLIDSEKEDLVQKKLLVRDAIPVAAVLEFATACGHWS
jgi:hypothetical protein